MGRPRSFDTDQVVALARDAFVAGGYDGTSVDDLLAASGLQRASLYSAFGSKRGLFVAAMRARSEDDVDLLLVALMGPARDDEEVRRLTEQALEGIGTRVREVLGDRLLARAGLDHRWEEGSR